MSCLRYQFVTTTELAIKYLHKSKRSLKCFGKIQHLAVLVKPREKNKHNLNKVGHWAIWAQGRWNVLGTFQRNFLPLSFPVKWTGSIKQRTDFVLV